MGSSLCNAIAHQGVPGFVSLSFRMTHMKATIHPLDSSQLYVCDCFPCMHAFMWLTCTLGVHRSQTGHGLHKCSSMFSLTMELKLVSNSWSLCYRWGPPHPLLSPVFQIQFSWVSISLRFSVYSFTSALSLLCLEFSEIIQNVYTFCLHRTPTLHEIRQVFFLLLPCWNEWSTPLYKTPLKWLFLLRC